jgi:catechol 2,3-dioxygenase-like lactoylglutathione lyase family enzyme
MKILFVSSMAIVGNDGPGNRKLYLDTLGLPLEQHPVDANYLFSEKMDGCKHFGVWPLTQAAQACFGTNTWPADKPAPQFCIEFEVANAEEVGAAAKELQAKGHHLIHDARTEPWGQTVARMLTHEGGILGISYAPWLHGAKP